MTNPAATSSSRYQSYAEFWPFYLNEHAKPATRAMHFAGTAGVFAFLAVAAATTRPILLIGAPVCGYGFAWVSHFFIEKNRPATFKYPLWSLVSDFRMFFLALGGRLAQHLQVAGVKR